ncbi:hypothetical protein QBC34DRAFT_100188 [Podospora aff. communis PSN243]|uniref:Uncharacterized protein n=1 Tax=Podospora aff. communis PSN243 TaxID=3040156 RepID=A0AAV9GMW2_9PEZI|nr:hypothetical protein QBC34DRAFT_100188 [Podospora aff. communis PSN243]
MIPQDPKNRIAWGFPHPSSSLKGPWASRLSDCEETKRCLACWPTSKAAIVCCISCFCLWVILGRAIIARRSHLKSVLSRVLPPKPAAGILPTAISLHAHAADIDRHDLLCVVRCMPDSPLPILSLRPCVLRGSRCGCQPPTCSLCPWHLRLDSRFWYLFVWLNSVCFDRCHELASKLCCGAGHVFSTGRQSCLVMFVAKPERQCSVLRY